MTNHINFKLAVLDKQPHSLGCKQEEALENDIGKISHNMLYLKTLLFVLGFICFTNKIKIFTSISRSKSFPAALSIPKENAVFSRFISLSKLSSNNLFSHKIAQTDTQLSD